MANVLFKRGLQKNLPANGSIEDGVFYLTTDTNRLYVGIGTNKKLLNQTVQIVSSISDLTTLVSQWGQDASSHINDFYYVSGSNILAVYTGTGSDSGWVQINPDHNTTIDTVELGAEVSNNLATITSTITDSQSTPHSGTMNISGDGSVHLTQTNDGFEISGDKYTLAKSVTATDSAILQLNSDSGVAADNSEVRLHSTNGNLSFVSSQTGIDITVKDTTLSGGSVAISANNGTLGVTVEDDDNNQATGSLSNVGILLDDGTALYAPLTTAGAGLSAGGVYSKTQIDQMMNGLDGMTYKGTIGESGATISTLPTTGVRNGDTYIVVSRGWTAASFTGATFETNTATEMSGGTRIGDMVIAKGTETNGVITNGLTWTYIPAGNDSLDAVTYEAIVDTTNNSIRLDNANDTTIAKLAFAEGQNGDIVLSSAVSTTGNTDDTLTTTISHKTYSAVTPSAASTLSNGTATFTALKSLTLTNGHVTGIETDTFTPVTYDLTGATLSQTSSVNSTTNVGTSTVSASIGLEDSSDGIHDSATLDFSSSTIKITGSGNTVTMNFEWGAF